MMNNTKPVIHGFLSLVLLVNVSTAGPRQTTREFERAARGERTSVDVETHLNALMEGLALFGDEVKEIELDLAQESGYSRSDLLNMYGQSALSSGRFALSAATHIVFLKEFGLNHDYSEAVAHRLIDGLFPFNYASTVVAHLPKGPVLWPEWRGGYELKYDHVLLAIHACELAHLLATELFHAGLGLYKLGWVYRALGEWDASTKAWKRCANAAPQISRSADCFWLAGENLNYTDQLVAELEHLRQFLLEFPNDSRVRHVTERISILEQQLVESRAGGRAHKGP